MISDPALVIQRLLISGSGAFVTAPEDGEDWPCYIDHEPDAPDSPSNCVTVFNTVGSLAARAHDGALDEAYGIQVRVRAVAQSDGYRMIQQLRDQLVNVVRRTMDLGDEEILVQTAQPVGGVIHLGMDNSKRRRWLFTANFLVWLSDIGA